MPISTIITIIAVEFFIVFAILLARKVRAVKSKDKWFNVKVFGVWFAAGRWFGNCFCPAVVFVWSGRKTPFERNGVNCYPAWAMLTFRCKKHRETVIYWRGGFRFDWQSEHVAARFGKVTTHPTSGCCYEEEVCRTIDYKGWLGEHSSYLG
tara:strand:- start:3180 stop:3632 length:453 start_codon:yes stop_codon:yes gene_type:complete